MVAMMDRPKRRRLLGPNTWREGSGRMTSPFTARQAGLASIVAAGLILVSQVSQLVLPLTLPESFWIATQSLRMGLALLAMFALLLALTELYARQGPEAGGLGFVGYLAAFLGTLLVAGNWWYEAFIGPALREQAPSSSPRPRAARSSSALSHGRDLRSRARVTWCEPAGGRFSSGRSGPVDGRRRRGRPGLDFPVPGPLALAVGWLGSWLVRSEAR